MYFEIDPLSVDIFDRYFYEVIIYMSIDGINMVKDLLTVGNINLYEFTEDKSNFLIDKSRKIIISNPYDSKKTKDFYLKHDADMISKFVGKTCAEFKIFAEYKLAIKYAEKECERVLDLLRYAVSFLYHKNHRVLIGLHRRKYKVILETLSVLNQILKTIM